MKAVPILERLKANLDAGKPARTFEATNEERAYLKSLHLLTFKPELVVYNTTEEPKNTRTQEHSTGITICAKLEAELAELSDEDREAMTKDLGVAEPGLGRLITASYNLLNLITYFTSGEKETRAWTIVRGAKAPQAAGVIHTDFERGFIAAEVIPWKTLVDLGGESAAKEQGLLKLEGKEYIVADGDVIHFRFAV